MDYTTMPDIIKGKLWDTILGVLVAISLGISGWTVKAVVEHGAMLASHSTTIGYNSQRLTDLETHGSRALEAHTQSDDQRVSDMQRRLTAQEEALRSLIEMKGDLKVIANAMQSLTERMKSLEELHRKNP